VRRLPRVAFEIVSQLHHELVPALQLLVIDVVPVRVGERAGADHAHDRACTVSDQLDRPPVVVVADAIGGTGVECSTRI